jgi:predicted transcriptional regulator
MLKDVLRLISESGMASMSELAEKTETTESTVEQAIALLVSKGYLALINVDHNCGKSYCTGCHIHCKTTSQKSENTYFITEKGRKYLGLPAAEQNVRDT